MAIIEEQRTSLPCVLLHVKIIYFFMIYTQNNHFTELSQTQAVTNLG